MISAEEEKKGYRAVLSVSICEKENGKNAGYSVLAGKDLNWVS